VSDFRKNIALDDAYLADVALPFYTTYAEHFSAYDPEMLFLETMNEPAIHEFFSGTYDEQVAQGIDRWNVVQPQIAAELRTGAPDHTLIAQGQTWDNIDSLLQTALLPDDNVIYNFHFYEPFPFTHQGATWTWDCVRSYKGIPYPSNPEVIAPFLEKVPAGECYDALIDYGETRWNQSKVQDMIQQAADWAEANGVYLTVNEFGAYKTYAPAESRITLLHDMRVSFEHFNIGWTMWDFNGGFDLVDEHRGSGTRSISPETAEALGLVAVSDS
ncbi:MAG TPA: cellulase family glycosylhydrolase, partial [Phototrophicaceae bacterium]|nr:cellulase family glycosylhydrolase [Phototrophicaceae bacterium]